MQLKPGFASYPFFGVEPALLDEQGAEIEGAGSGYLVIKRSWPAQIRTVYGDHQRMIDTYFTTYPGITSRVMVRCEMRQAISALPDGWTTC